MGQQRLNQLAEDVRWFVFCQLDGELDMTGEDAGKVAAAVETTFRDSLLSLLGEDQP